MVFCVSGVCEIQNSSNHRNCWSGVGMRSAVHFLPLKVTQESHCTRNLELSPRFGSCSSSTETLSSTWGSRSGGDPAAVPSRTPTARSPAAAAAVIPRRAAELPLPGASPLFPGEDSSCRSQRGGALPGRRTPRRNYQHGWNYWHSDGSFVNEPVQRADSLLWTKSLPVGSRNW